MCKIQAQTYVSMLNLISLCKMCALFDTYASVNWHSLYNIVIMLGLWPFVLNKVSSSV